MTHKPTSFRDRLLAVEPLPASVQERYQQEIQQMLTKELSRPHRAFIAVVLLASVAMAGLFVFLLATEASLPTPARIGFLLGLVFSLGWIVVAAKVLRQGAIDLVQDERRIAQMVWVFTVGMTVLFLYTGMSTLGTGKEMLGLMLMVQSLVFLIGAAVFLLVYRINAAELSMKERLLHLEMQLTAQREQGA
jgi:protein-S-isoprenylcysteine O-methyltransferase Ste14